MLISLLKKVLLLTVCLISLTLTCLASDVFIKAPTVNSLLSNAEDLYTKNRYLESIEIYKGLINKGIRNDKIYYNLANAYLKIDRVPEAIINYENALVFAPRDPDIQANLDYAVALSPANMQAENQNDQFSKIIFFWYYYLNAIELSLLFLCMNFLSCVLILVDYIYENEVLSSLKYFFIVVSAILLISVGVKIFENYNISKGIVIDNSVDVKSGNNNDFATLYKMKQGSPFGVLISNGDWLKITDEQGKKGWIPKKSVGLVDAHF